MTKSAAGNGRFGAMAAVSPQTILYEIARYYPAGSSVEAATAPSRRTLEARQGSVSANGKQIKNTVNKKWKLGNT